MTLPTTMMAICVIDGEPHLKAQTIAVPQPKAGEVLIRVTAAGLNRADLLQASGHHPPPPGAPDTPGLEASGVAVAAGAGASEWLGREVCALLPGGGYAEYAVASTATILKRPQSVSLVDAGGLPEAYFTVWSNVIDTARLKPDESFLVHGGTSGIGTAAIQLMHARGHRVFTTAGTAEKCDVCTRLGARAINYRVEDFVAVVKSETEGRGVDVILDMIGGDYVGRNLMTLARGGRLVNISYNRGPKVEVDFRLVQKNNLTISATGLRGRPEREKRALRDVVLAQVWPLIEDRRIKPMTWRTFPLAEAASAHAAMREGGHIGKLLLIP